MDPALPPAPSGPWQLAQKVLKAASPRCASPGRGAFREQLRSASEIGGVAPVLLHAVHDECRSGRPSGIRPRSSPRPASSGRDAVGDGLANKILRRQTQKQRIVQSQRGAHAAIIAVTAGAIFRIKSLEVRDVFRTLVLLRLSPQPAVAMSKTKTEQAVCDRPASILPSVRRCPWASMPARAASGQLCIVSMLCERATTYPPTIPKAS